MRILLAVIVIAGSAVLAQAAEYEYRLQAPAQSAEETGFRYSMTGARALRPAPANWQQAQRQQRPTYRLSPNDPYSPNYSYLSRFYGRPRGPQNPFAAPNHFDAAAPRGGIGFGR